MAKTTKPSKAHILHSLTSSQKVADALKANHSDSLDCVIGCLGAIEKGGNAVRSSEEDKKDAKRISRVIMGLDEGRLTSSDAERIAQLVNAFLRKPAHHA